MSTVVCVLRIHLIHTRFEQRMQIDIVDVFIRHAHLPQLFIELYDIFIQPQVTARISLLRQYALKINLALWCAGFHAIDHALIVCENVHYPGMQVVQVHDAHHDEHLGRPQRDHTIQPLQHEPGRIESNPHIADSDIREQFGPVDACSNAVSQKHDIALVLWKNIQARQRGQIRGRADLCRRGRGRIVKFILQIIQAALLDDIPPAGNQYAHIENKGNQQYGVPDHPCLGTRNC